ncbi:hypothetical protein CLV37_1411, partial [Kineococcus rhizosphaerae]
MTTQAAASPAARSTGSTPSGTRRSSTERKNWLGGTFGWLWLLVVLVPIYWIVITSFKTSANYFGTNPLIPPSSPTLANYEMVLEADFLRYFANSLIVTVGATVPAVLISFMAAFAIVRGGGRWLKAV